jgi:hypothetical protein
LIFQYILKEQNVERYLLLQLLTEPLKKQQGVNTPWGISSY